MRPDNCNLLTGKERTPDDDFLTLNTEKIDNKYKSKPVIYNLKAVHNQTSSG